MHLLVTWGQDNLAMLEVFQSYLRRTSLDSTLVSELDQRIMLK